MAVQLINDVKHNVTYTAYVIIDREVNKMGQLISEIPKKKTKKVNVPFFRHLKVLGYYLKPWGAQGRWWDSSNRGTAYSDGNGWYTDQKPV